MSGVVPQVSASGEPQMETEKVSCSSTAFMARVRTSNLPCSDGESSKTGPQPSEWAMHSGTTFLSFSARMIELRSHVFVSILATALPIYANNRQLY